MLSEFTIYTTEGTANKILGTGLYHDGEVQDVGPASIGGIARLAAMVVRGDCMAVIMLMDPTDSKANTIENDALRRACVGNRIRLLSTYLTAAAWLKNERDSPPDNHGGDTFVINLPDAGQNVGVHGEFIALDPEARTLSLIAHDKEKNHMIEFCNRNMDLLEAYEKGILATGTTGWLLKLLFADNRLRSECTFLEGEAKSKRDARNLVERLTNILQIKRRETHNPRSSIKDTVTNLEQLVRGYQAAFPEKLNLSDKFSENIYPLPSGPKGGDILIANLVLSHRCHEIIFFQDANTAHPHQADIRLLERACQLPGIYTTLISDYKSAESSFKKRRIRYGAMVRVGRRAWTLSQQLREMYGHLGLRDAVIIPDSSKRNDAVALAAAGYIHEYILSGVRQASLEGRPLRIGVGLGSTVKAVADAAEVIIDRCPLPKDVREAIDDTHLHMWPTIGVAATETFWPAEFMTSKFSDIYTCHQFSIPYTAFVSNAMMQQPDRIDPKVFEFTNDNLLNLDAVLVGISAWQDSPLRTHLVYERRLITDGEQMMGHVDAVLLDKDGRPTDGRFKLAGLDIKVLQSLAQNDQGGVIAVCEEQDGAVDLCLGLLNAGIISILIAPSSIAEGIVDKSQKSLETA